MKKGYLFRTFLSLCLVIAMTLLALPLSVLAADTKGAAVDPSKYLTDRFFIKNKNSGKYLSVRGGKAANGTNVLQWSFNGKTDQQWKLAKHDHGSYEIVSALSGGYRLNIAGNSNKNGANVQIWNSTQTFRLVKTSGNNYKLETSASGSAKKVISVSGSSKKDGANVNQWSFGSSGNDQWQFERVVVSKKKATTSQKNAVAKAKSYLKFAAFSHQGLVDQLEYEKFSKQDALYGADHCGANWNEQAVRKAKSYLDLMAFSKKGLIDQLLYEGFTEQQASYGVDRCGANWNEQAVKKAKSYLDLMAFSKQGLIDQLLYDGFTEEQAAYGVSKNGF